MCDGVGNQQLAPEGRTQGKVCFVQTHYVFCDVRNWEETEREREKVGQWELN
jgi:hypothetical protein